MCCNATVEDSPWPRRYESNGTELAREYDISPSLLLADSAIIEAAQRKPHNASQFRAVRSLNERVRMHLGNEQDKMFERYAPIQRKVKPSLWKRTIQEALDSAFRRASRASRQSGWSR